MNGLDQKGLRDFVLLNVGHPRVIHEELYFPSYTDPNEWVENSQIIPPGSIPYDGGKCINFTNLRLEPVKGL